MTTDFSPWGKIDWSETLAPGFEMVATASHGGIMVTREAALKLTPAARRCGSWNGGYLCFEEDAAENVVLRELLDRKLWKIPDRIKDRAAFEESIDQNIKKYNPGYWNARERRLSKEGKPPLQPQPAVR